MNLKQDRALGALVSAIGQVDFPQALSSFVKKIIPFDNMTVISYHKGQKPEILYLESFDPQICDLIETQYVQASYLLDPFFQAIDNGIQTGIYRLFDLAPDKFKVTAYFKEYYSQTSANDELAIFVQISHDITLTICFTRDKVKNKKFSKNEILLLRHFQHSLSSLCKAHWQDYQPKEGKNISLPPVSSRLRIKLYTEKGIQLSPRQAEVALLVLQGHSSLSISLHLNISKETVKVFRRQLYSKCNISSQVELFTLMMPTLSSL